LVLSTKTEEQLMLLSTLYATQSVTNINNLQQPIGQRIRACVSTALGLSAIANLVSNTSALMTVRGTIAILKTVGSRYLSWIGVAWMIMDFTDCLYG
jgi:hypothetical protein